MVKDAGAGGKTVETVEIVWQGRPGAEVFLVGDFPDWGVRHPLPEDPERPGRYRRTLALGPGLYRYKLVVDGQWVLDPRAPVVDRSEGVDNGVLVVLGASPPLHFVPDRRHLAILEGGRVRLHAEIDEGRAHEITAAIVGAGDGDERELPFLEILRRGGRVLVEAEGAVPGADDGRVLTVGFRGIDERFGAPRARSALGRPPAWLAGAVFYGVFLDRWRRGRSSGPERRMLAPTTPSTPFVFYGGDLDGVREQLPYLADLGVTALALTPVHRADSPHRYDGHDLMVVDPRLGGERAFAALIEDCRRHGLKLVVDASLTHVSEKHAAFVDLLEKQEASLFASWFRVKRFPVVKRDPATFEHYYNCRDLPWLRLDEGSPARAHAIEAALRLVDFGVDGLRLDAMDDAPASFWAELRARVRAKNPELLLLGEIVGDNLATRAEERGVDVATDFRIRDALVGFVARRTLDARGFVEHLTFSRHRTGAFDPSFRLGFLDNHDTARFLSLADDARLCIGLALLLFLEETAWITYGTEAHLAARRGESPLDASWPERLPMPDPATVTTRTRDLIRELCALRREMTAAGAGRVQVRLAEGPHLVLERGAGERRFFVDVDVDARTLVFGRRSPAG